MSRFTDRPTPAGPEPTPSEPEAGDTTDEIPRDEQSGRYLKNVLWSSVIWTIGNALTTGGFLTYFAAELGI
ncbi:MAG: hypothetical protein KDA68_03875, partial [Planctomycetaceae bacterium]|nr:hypothetical protein [Planctomycetaceae bacterium]